MYHSCIQELGSPAKDYADAALLLEEMDRLRRVWAGVRPVPPVTRAELNTLGIINHLLKQGVTPITVGQLAKHMGQSMPGVSQKVSVLEKQGYLKRVSSKDDRRVVTVELTEKGRYVSLHTMEEFLSRMEEALHLLGKEKTNTLVGLMGELSTAIETVNIKKGNEDD